MTRSRIGSTLTASLLLFGAGAAGAQQADSLRAPSSWVVYAGLAEGAQFLAGGQLLLRTPWRPASLVPELAIAHGASLLASIGLHLAPVTSKVGPYAGISAGYLWEGSDDDSNSRFVFTPKAGLLFNTAALDGLFGSKAAGWMFEYQGIDWFEQSRFLVGVRWTF